MAEETAVPQEAIREAKIMASIEIKIDDTGRHSMITKDIDGNPLTFNEQRTVLRWALDVVGDNVMAVFMTKYIDNALSQKIKPNGFREKSILDFLKIGK